MTEAPAVRPVRSVTSRRWDVFRWFLLAGWIAVAVAIPLSSSRTSTWDELTERVESGKVTAVQVSRELPARRDGEVTVHLQWKDGPWRHVTEVTQVSEDREFDVVDNDRSTETLTSSPTAELKTRQPGLVVSDLDVPDDEVAGFLSVEEARFLGFELTLALTVAAAALTVAGLVLLFFGPNPWRATKWAWFWLMGMPPVAALFVLLSGPVPGLPPPRRPLRRLTGGWAFVIAVLLGSAFAFV